MAVNSASAPPSLPHPAALRHAREPPLDWALGRCAAVSGEVRLGEIRGDDRYVT